LPVSHKLTPEENGTSATTLPSGEKIALRAFSGLEKLPTTPIGSTFTCGPLSWAGPGRRRCCAEESAGINRSDNIASKAARRNETPIQFPPLIAAAPCYFFAG
jgi:hypothetical protein